MNDTYNLDDITNLISLLRSKDGCPWIRTQDYDSTKQYILEEVYEVLEAVDLKDRIKLREELGDVLFEILLYCQFGKEDKAFTIDDVIQGIGEKIKTRYTHIFGSDKALTAEEVERKWNINKNKRRKIVDLSIDLDSLPKELPALIRAEKVQQKVLRSGKSKIDTKRSIDLVTQKIIDFDKEYMKYDRGKLEEKIGDILFEIVTLSLSLEVQGEFALTKSINNYIAEKDYRLGEARNE